MIAFAIVIRQTCIVLMKCIHNIGRATTHEERTKGKGLEK